MSPVQQFAALLTWDILITLDTEVKYLWRRPKSSSCGAFMFFTVRYSVPISNIFIAVFSFANDIVIVSIIMIQRMYALYSRDKRILWGLSVTAICLTGIIVWLMQNQAMYRLSVLPGCHMGLSRETHRAYHMATAWGILFAFDTIIFALTICNAYFMRIRVGTHAEANMPLYTIIIRDGAFAIALANLANIATFIIGGPVIPGSLSSFTTGISVTMVCRLMMNIYEKADVDAKEFDLPVLQDCATIQLQAVDSPDAVSTHGVHLCGQLSA
ncbi:hypothetical protein B0H13DRAFT_2345217 [Mycena leptocephala]|nr:hypothetical protein B0H13DRAFT_2345217 [Mycena leptocephala]